MVCRSSRLVIRNSGLCLCKTLANTECPLYLLSCWSFQHKDIFGLSLVGSCFLRGFILSKQLWKLQWYCQIDVWFLFFRPSEAKAKREQTNKVGDTTASSVSDHPFLFLRPYGPKEMYWLSLLNLKPTEMPSHYYIAFIGIFSTGHFIYSLFIFNFQGKSALWSHLLQYQEREEKQEHSAESPGEYPAIHSLMDSSQWVNSALWGRVQPHKVHMRFSVYLLANTKFTFWGLS